MEFASATPETVAMQTMFKAVGELPELVIFDPAAPAPVLEPVSAFLPELDSFADPVDELRMLFGSVN